MRVKAGFMIMPIPSGSIRRFRIFCTIINSTLKSTRTRRSSNVLRISINTSENVTDGQFVTKYNRVLYLNTVTKYIRIREQ